MAYTVGYALLGALCVALFLIPGLAFYAYRKPGKIYHNRWLEKLSTAYHSQIVRLMEKPRRVIVPLLAILLGAGILSYTVGKDFLPPLDEGRSGYRYSFLRVFPLRNLRRWGRSFGRL